MLTSLTTDLGFWIIFSTVLISIGTYKLLTKQNADANLKNSEQIKELGEKIENFSMDIKLTQVELGANFKNMNEKINKIEGDTAVTRVQSNNFSESIARIEVRLQNVERGRNNAIS